MENEPGAIIRYHIQLVLRCYATDVEWVERYMLTVRVICGSTRNRATRSSDRVIVCFAIGHHPIPGPKSGTGHPS